MNPLDIVIIAVLGFCLVRGILKGLIRELASIAALLTGLSVAYIYFKAVSSYISSVLPDIPYINVWCFMGIFFVVYIAVIVIASTIRGAVKKVSLGWLDRLLGGGFGTLKGILIVSALFIAFTSFAPKGSAIIKDSRLSIYVLIISESLYDAIPNDYKEGFFNKIKELKKYKTENHGI